MHSGVQLRAAEETARADRLEIEAEAALAQSEMALQALIEAESE
jgi:hypothetical protein